MSHLCGFGAALAAPPWETLALEPGPHPRRLLLSHPSHNPVPVSRPGPLLRHHLPAAGVQVEVGPGCGFPPLASALRGAQGPAAEVGGRGHVHQVTTQGVVDEGSDGVAGGLRRGEKNINNVLKDRMFKEMIILFNLL